MSKQSKSTVYVVFEDGFSLDVKGVYRNKKTLLKFLRKEVGKIQEHLRAKSCVDLVESDDTILESRYDINVENLSTSYHVDKCEIEAPAWINTSNLEEVWIVTSMDEWYIARLYYHKNDAEITLRPSEIYPDMESHMELHQIQS